MRLPKFVTKQLAAHDFSKRSTVYVTRFGNNIKPRNFTASPVGMYMQGADSFGERHINVTEKNIMTGEVMHEWTVVVGNSCCYQI